ncbi:hypothetical protein [Streptomyces acidiscabies]|nr:hypothetical protein [Streptomyces acidiscabies]
MRRRRAGIAPAPSDLPSGQAEFGHELATVFADTRRLRRIGSMNALGEP